MSKFIKIISIVGFLIAGVGAIIKYLHELGYGINLIENYNKLENSFSSFAITILRTLTWKEWKDLYLYLFLVICLNLILLFFKKNLKFYTLVSLIIPTSLFMFFIVLSIKYISIFQMSIISLSIVYIFIYLLLLKIKANWYIVSLVNCFYIFTYINWLEILNISILLSPRNPFMSYHPIEFKFNDPIRYNIENRFNFGAIGYFVSNAGIIVVILSIAVLIILNRTKRTNSP
ncbi:UNVERIFIED_CONTAM: hypothetical protein Cloal_2695 [Acetivibrio alkalicellulosi]